MYMTPLYPNPPSIYPRGPCLGRLHGICWKIDSVRHRTQTQSGVWTEIDLEEKSSVRPRVLMGSCDVYDPPLGQPILKLPQDPCLGTYSLSLSF